MRPQQFIGVVEVLPSLGDHAGSVIVVFGLSPLQYVGGNEVHGEYFIPPNVLQRGQPEDDDDATRVIAETRQYLDDADELLRSHTAALALLPRDAPSLSQTAQSRRAVEWRQGPLGLTGSRHLNVDCSLLRHIRGVASL